MKNKLIKTIIGAVMNREILAMINFMDNLVKEIITLALGIL